MPKALLFSLRQANDSMASHELQCFATAARLDADDITAHHMIGGPPADHLYQGIDAIFLGGSGAYSVLDDLDWIRRSIDILEHIVSLQIPTYASCFGFQGLALALGGKVREHEEGAELGSTQLTLTKQGQQDPLFGFLPTTFWGQEGHSDYVVELPTGVTQLVTGTRCHEQAFRVDGAPFWASQFHPELTLNNTLERFQHYGGHYLPQGNDSTFFETLRKGKETPQVSELLARLVRGQF